MYIVVIWTPCDSSCCQSSCSVQVGVLVRLHAPSTAIEGRAAAFARITMVVKSLSQWGRNSSVGTSAADGFACSALSTCA